MSTKVNDSYNFARLIRELAIAAGGYYLARSIGMKILSLANEAKEGQRVPISIFSECEMPSRKFKGICLNRTIKIVCSDDTSLVVPTDLIWHIISASSGDDESAAIYLLDGSYYSVKAGKRAELSFLTMVGLQKVVIKSQVGYESATRITGYVVSEDELCRSKIKELIKQKEDEIKRTLGENVFSQLNLGR